MLLSSSASVCFSKLAAEAQICVGEEETNPTGRQGKAGGCGTMEHLHLSQLEEECWAKDSQGTLQMN